MKGLQLVLLFAAVARLADSVHANRQRRAATDKCKIILYEHDSSRGRRLILSGPKNNLVGFPVRAVNVVRCRWQLFGQINYREPTLTLSPGNHYFHFYKDGFAKIPSLEPVGSHGVCTVSGDPHFRTFDHLMIHFMGICTYTLAKPCNARGAGLQDFHVMIKGERRNGNKRISYSKYLLVDIGDMRFKLDKNRVVYLNGEKLHLPISKESVTVRLNGRNVELSTKLGLKVTFDGNHLSTVNVPNRYRNAVCGLCGNWNGDAKDDMKDSKGVLQKHHAAVGNSWAVPGVDQSCAKEPPTWPKCSSKDKKIIQSSKWCGMLSYGRFKQCHNTVDYKAFVTNCYYDLCSLGVTKKVFCKSLESYADQCRGAGLSVDWRTWAGCPLPCPSNSDYKFCMSACPNTCTDPNAAKTCKRPCVEGCECRAGFSLGGRKCVPRDQCGCQYGGSYRQLGETWTDKTCGKRYMCKSGNKVVTTPLGCTDPNSQCKLADGSWGCHCKQNYRKIKGKCMLEKIAWECPAGYERKGNFCILIE